MTWMLVAARPIELAIFFTLGTLWVGGATFIYLLWRWIVRSERGAADSGARASSEAAASHSSRPGTASSAEARPHPAAA